MGIGERITIGRKQKGLSQQQLADQVGVTRASCSQWERNVSAPSVNHLAEVVIEVCNSASKVVRVDPRPGDIRFACSDSERARLELPWSAEQDFERALRRTVEWFRDGKSA